MLVVEYDQATRDLSKIRDRLNRVGGVSGMLNGLQRSHRSFTGITNFFHRSWVTILFYELPGLKRETRFRFFQSSRSSSVICSGITILMTMKRSPFSPVCPLTSPR